MMLLRPVRQAAGVDEQAQIFVDAVLLVVKSDESSEAAALGSISG